MFRYESPQKGRYRQFYQAGFEIINYKNKSLEFQVLEIIILAKEILKNLEITQFQLKINFLSNAKTRIEYARNLRAYFEKFIDKLEPISRSRIKNNPLRILDDKIEAKKDFVKLAPKINTFWTNEDLDKFNLITTVLDKFQIAYKIDYNLVRGLDYYDDFVFEFIDTSNTLGTKLTLVGGGCYNNLSLKFGPDNLHNIGMAFGIERIIEILKTKSRFSYKKLDFFLIGFNYTEIIENFKIANLLREQNFQVDLNKSPLSINKGFQKAKKSGARFAFFFEKNQEKNYISLKNLQTGKNCEILYSKFDLENLNYIINEGKNV